MTPLILLTRSPRYVVFWLYSIKHFISNHCQCYDESGVCYYGAFTFSVGISQPAMV